MTPIPSLWQRYKYWLSALLLLPTVWFTWQAFNPSFPPSWEQQAVGPFTVTLTPLSNARPYPYGDGYMKDFAVTFCDGCWSRIRSAHLAAGRAPAELSAELDGLLHGGRHIQHVHAPFPRQPTAGDRLWLTVEDWQGRRYYAAWLSDGRVAPPGEALTAAFSQEPAH